MRRVCGKYANFAFQPYNRLQMKIGSIDLGNRPLFLAPMEDVTNAPFRLLCKEFGADMVTTEFVSSDALIRAVDKTQAKLSISDAERPVAIQIYGRDVDSMVEAARICEEARPDIIDLNFGCPVKKVAGKGAGSGMLRNVPLMLAITRAVVNAVKLPVTVKTRLGWDHDSRIIVELAEQLQDCGIAALAVHGRTRSQMYTGEADWTLIGKVKENPRYDDSRHRKRRHHNARRCVCGFRPLWSRRRNGRAGLYRRPVDFRGDETVFAGRSGNSFDGVL